MTTETVGDLVAEAEVWAARATLVHIATGGTGTRDGTLPSDTALVMAARAAALSMPLDRRVEAHRLINQAADVLARLEDRPADS